jgi:hypothetical protein
VERDADGQVGGGFYSWPTIRFQIWQVCGSGRSFALEFQQIILGMFTTAEGHSGIEAGFLLAVGELSRSAINIESLSQNSDAGREELVLAASQSS